jgi:hypothetical protein
MDEETLLESLQTLLDASISTDFVATREERLGNVLALEEVRGEICVLIFALLKESTDQALLLRFLMFISFESAVERLAKSPLLEEALIQAGSSIGGVSILELISQSKTIWSSKNVAIVLDRAATLLKSSDIHQAEVASKLFDSAVSCDRALEDSVFLEEVAACLNEGYLKILPNYTFAMRYLAIISKIAASGEAQFRICDSIGAPAALVGLCNNTDLLVQLVAFEQLQNFSVHSCGIEFLFRSGLMQMLLQLAFSPVGSTDALLGPQALRELCKILCTASSRHLYIPWNLLDSPEYNISMFLEGLKFHLKSSDVSLHMCGLQVVCSYAGSSVEALSSVMCDSELLHLWISNVNSTHQMQASTLHGVAHVLEALIISTPPSRVLDSTASSLWKRLFEVLVECKRMKLSVYLLKLARQEIDTTKSASLVLMKVLLQKTGSWGLEQLLSNSDLISYLEDPYSESTKIGKELKFAVIEAICSNEHSAFLGETLHSRLETLRQRGPFYQPGKIAEPMTT